MPLNIRSINQIQKYPHISSNYFGALFIKINSIKDLETNTCILFNFDFVNNTNLLRLFFIFYFFIDLCFLIPAVAAQIFNPMAELVFPIGIQ